MRHAKLIGDWLIPNPTGERRARIVHHRLSGRALEVSELAGEVGQPALMFLQCSLAYYQMASSIDPFVEAIRKEADGDRGSHISSPSLTGAGGIWSHCSSRWKSRSLDSPNYPGALSPTGDGSHAGSVGIAKTMLPASETALREGTKNWHE